LRAVEILPLTRPSALDRSDKFAAHWWLRFHLTNGLLPTLGGEACAIAFVEKKICGQNYQQSHHQFLFASESRSSMEKLK
jgi:hypothetical protein